MARRQAEAMTVDQHPLIGEIYVEDWSKSSLEEEEKELEPTIEFATIAFCMSLRGEEVPLTVIEGLNIY